MRLFAGVLKNNLAIRFPNEGSDNMVYCIAAYVDPYDRGVLLEMVYNNLPAVKEEIVRRWGVETNNNLQAVPNPVSVSEDPIENMRRRRTEQQAAASNEPGQTRCKLREEMVRYEMKPPVDKDVDVSGWWSHQDDLPILKRVAREILGVMVSSSSSERVFSTSGKVNNSFSSTKSFLYSFKRCVPRREPDCKLKE